MPVHKAVEIRRGYFNSMRERGWETGSVLRHKATGAVVMIGVPCLSGVHHNDSYFVMIDSRRERWRVGKLVEECE